MQWIDPQVVVVTMRHRDLVEALAGIHRLPEVVTDVIDRVVILWVGHQVVVVPGSLVQLHVVVDMQPAAAGIV